MTSPPFNRVLIANRGEIAVRLIRACHELGMEVVAIYSDADAGAQHVAMADLAVRIGPPAPADSYLRIDRIIEAAQATGSRAIHPGYGFLAERAAFAQAAEEAGIAFVGPSSATIDALGDKLHARRLARSIGVDPVPGTFDPAPVGQPEQVARIVEEAEAIGFPLLVKAAAGGGGRGMRRVASSDELAAALMAASAEALSAFGDGSVYLEREIHLARHIEVQLLGDSTGHVVALGERGCSVQRRHQKLIEEAPAPGLTTGERRALHDQAARLAMAAGLRNAATAEFLRSPDGAFLFLEVNTRLQVEHGVTELVSGLDIVHEQFRVAAGEPLSAAVLAAAERAATPTTHAVEVRLTAEDPSLDFLPTPGTLRRWVMPSGPGVRVDTGLVQGDRIPQEYDNLMAKIMVLGPDRDRALDRLDRALGEVLVAGVQTTLPFHRWVVNDPSFRAGALSTTWVGEHWDGPARRGDVAERAARLAGAAVLDGRIQAGVAAAEGDAGPGGEGRRGPVDPTSAAGHPSGWLVAGRADAVDRWPR